MPADPHATVNGKLDGTTHARTLDHQSRSALPERALHRCGHRWGGVARRPMSQRRRPRRWLGRSECATDRRRSGVARRCASRTSDTTRRCGKTFHKRSLRFIVTASGQSSLRSGRASAGEDRRAVASARRSSFRRTLISFAARNRPSGLGAKLGHHCFLQQIERQQALIDDEVVERERIEPTRLRQLHASA
jgi:hypothetical protein